MAYASSVDAVSGPYTEAVQPTLHVFPASQTYSTRTSTMVQKTRKRLNEAAAAAKRNKWRLLDAVDQLMIQ